MLALYALHILGWVAPLGMAELESIREIQAASPARTVTAARQCAPGPRAPSPGCAPASVPLCVVALDRGTTRVRITDASRRACLDKAQLVERDLLPLSDDVLRAGPPSPVAFSAHEDVHCRLQPRPEQGGSLKFRCMRTNAANQLYDEDGDLIPAAVSVDADGHLLDAQGGKIRDEGGNALEGDELRVKYFVGREPEARYREMFTETVVSRLFWALGIPVDHVYMPASVRCLGCTANPFGQAAPTPSPTPEVFRLASVERPLQGKRISVPRDKGPFGLGGKYDHGFGFDEIGQLLPGLPDSRRVEAEVMAIALNIVAYNNTHSYQNDLVCRKGKWDKVSGACAEVVAYVADVGGTLGGVRAFMIKGAEQPAMRWYPRGDYVTLTQGMVFLHEGTCTLRYRIGAVGNVSEAAREAMDARIRGRIGREQLRIIFEAASIQHMEKQVNDLVASQYRLRPGPELDRGVQLLWADEMLGRLHEVLTARCPG